jgi:hypothetical protein
MWQWLNETLMSFKNCFNNKRTFVWFVIIVIGLMLRTDHAGISSIVREMSLIPSTYTSMLHFFRSEGLYINWIQNKWQRIVQNLPLLYRMDGRPVMISDGVKNSKEGRYMPGVKKLHQESENSAKGEYIFGHMFGGIGLLLGNAGKKLYCVLISLKLHDGLSAIHGWYEDETYEEESHVVKTIKDAIAAARTLGPSLLLLDRLYLTVPMLKTLKTTPLLHVVTKAKWNATAFFDPPIKTGRGAKYKKGEKVKVAEYLRSHAVKSVKEAAYVYGKIKTAVYSSADLLWGDTLYQKLRFVLAEVDGKESILVSTDLTLTPAQIIELYSCRFRIECSFRELKQVVAGFCYRFWSKSMPKLNRYKKNEEQQEQIKTISDESQRANIIACVKAIETHALLSCIALGMLQIMSLLFSSSFSDSAVRFMRTKSNEVPSEATVACFMRKNIYQLFNFFPDLPITRLIKNHQSLPVDSEQRKSA